MSFLVAFNGQFSPYVHPSAPNRVVSPVTPLTSTREVQHFRDVLEEAGGPEVYRRAAPGVEAYRQNVKKFEAQKKRTYARDIMSSPVHTIKETSTAGEARALLQKFGFRHLPVVNESQVICGILSDREICQADEKQSCSSLMVREVIVCEEHASINEIAIILLREKINSLPIINNKHELIGIVTLSDILRHVIESTSFLGNA